VSASHAHIQRIEGSSGRALGTLMRSNHHRYKGLRGSPGETASPCVHNERSYFPCSLVVMKIR
jgi:hypothetical protein